MLQSYFENGIIFYAPEEQPDIVDTNKIFNPINISSLEYFKKLHDSTHAITGYPIQYLASLYNKFLHLNKDIVYIKMLNVFNDGNPYSYIDVFNSVLKPQGKRKGYNIDQFKNLINEGYIQYSNVGNTGKTRYYKITEFGKSILEIASINNAAYRVIRHFTKCDNNEFIAKMIQEDLEGGESWNDLSPETLIIMLKSIFEGDIHKIGSHCYWMNKLIESYKKSNIIRNAINHEDVKSYINTLTISNTEAKNFKRCIAKLDVKLH